jgi:hypothetical protein
MKGLPDHFGTKDDISNCMKVDPMGTKIMLERLLDGRMGWFKVADLAEDDPGLNDIMHEVRLEPVDPNVDFMAGDVPMKKVLYEKRDDLLSELFRLGLTVAEVQGYIKSIAV